MQIVISTRCLSEVCLLRWSSWMTEQKENVSVQKQRRRCRRLQQQRTRRRKWHQRINEHFMVDYIYVKIYDTLRTLKVMLTEFKRIQTLHIYLYRCAVDVDVIDDIYTISFPHKTESGWTEVIIKATTAQHTPAIWCIVYRVYII